MTLPLFEFLCIVYISIYIQGFTWYSSKISDKRNESMMTTRVFKSGNSQAVRIPKKFQYPRLDLELEIERHGDELRIRPKQRTLVNVVKRFGAFSKNFMEKGREKETDVEREAL